LVFVAELGVYVAVYEAPNVCREKGAK
jgi:hypothetical protein